MSTADQILTVLAQVADTPEVCSSPDLRLYDLDILDSLKTVELIVAFSDRFGVQISPAELERDQWATPSRIVAYMQDRIKN
jgi:D-alanine--poly(phosphoribitol) ligase subunit 2